MNKVLFNESISKVESSRGHNVTKRKQFKYIMYNYRKTSGESSLLMQKILFRLNNYPMFLVSLTSQKNITAFKNDLFLKLIYRKIYFFKGCFTQKVQSS